MKYLLGKTAVAVALLISFVNSPARAQNADNSGCSNGTLHGEYAFNIAGQIIGGMVPGPVNGVAITAYDGQGNLQQTDFVVKNGVPAGPANAFRAGESGTYTVNSDCTGVATINFPDATPPQKVVLMFVVAKKGRKIQTVVAALYVGPGIASNTPTAAQIVSEGTKIELNEHQ